ncbi:MAG: M23 family metallopeptidase [Parvularculaceae bacterium]|nr:M23 family metallopeptidase [Parvularculaceae bacterium]
MRQLHDNRRVAGAPTEGAAQRAPLAAAAALGVLAGGAAFLAYAMSRPTDTPTASRAAPIVIASPAPEKKLDQPARISKPIAPAAAPAVEPPDEMQTTPASGDELAAFGGPLRIKPSRDVATGEMSAPPTAVMTLASPFIAQVEDRPAPFYFEADLRNDNSQGSYAETISDGDLPDAPHERLIALAKGETFVDALARAGIRAEDRNAAAYALGKLFNMRRLRPSHEFILTLVQPHQTFFQSVSSADTPASYLLSLEFRVDAENRITLTRTTDGSYSADASVAPLTTRIAAIQGRIDGSLYLSAKRQGAPDEVIAGLAQIFAYDVDFQREIFGGDEFEAIFEVRYDDAGNLVGGGDILFGRLKWRGRQKEKGYYRFETAEGRAAPDYFDEKGESARRLLMKTPIDGARLSSGFGTRKHPILGYAKAHKGVDFAAARGTPIMAAGDGVIERAGPYGSFGNYVRIRHAQGYKTAYAHMNAIKKGVRTGVRVRQGDVIGYVGTTGRSTGPHLHYEVHLRDKPVNPQSLKIATGYELQGADLTRFRSKRDEIDMLRQGVNAEHARLLADKSENDSL